MDISPTPQIACFFCFDVRTLKCKGWLLTGPSGGGVGGDAYCSSFLIVFHDFKKLEIL